MTLLANALNVMTTMASILVINAKVAIGKEYYPVGGLTTQTSMEYITISMGRIYIVKLFLVLMDTSRMISIAVNAANHAKVVKILPRLAQHALIVVIIW
jgi:hypothetical protein